jgi:hypothetical protein
MTSNGDGEVGLVAVGVVISDSMEPMALHYFRRDFLLLGVRYITKRRKFKLTLPSLGLP